MTQTVPDVGIAGVGLVLHIALPKGVTICLCFRAGQAQTGPHIPAAPGRDARHAVQAGSAGQPEQQRFRLVVQRVGRGNDGLLPRCQFIKPAVAEPPRPVLAGVFRDGHALPWSIVQKQLHTVSAAEFLYKIRISPGGLAADAVVHMGGQHFHGQVPAAAQQKQQQRHGIRTAGTGRNDPISGLEQTLLSAIGKQRLFGGFYEVVSLSNGHVSRPNC